MAQFRAKKIDLGCFINIKVIRDHTKRKVYEQYETQRYAFQISAEISVDPNPLTTSPCACKHRAPSSLDFATVSDDAHFSRQALRYLIRNTTLPQRTRAQAQLELSQMHCYTRSTQINNRCIDGGKSRGVLKDFRMSRYPFRMHALEGSIPGVKKASW